MKIIFKLVLVLSFIFIQLASYSSSHAAYSMPLQHGGKPILIQNNMILGTANHAGGHAAQLVFNGDNHTQYTGDKSEEASHDEPLQTGHSDHEGACCSGFCSSVIQAVDAPLTAPEQHSDNVNFIPHTISKAPLIVLLRPPIS